MGTTMLQEADCILQALYEKTSPSLTAGRNAVLPSVQVSRRDSARAGFP